MSDSPSLASGSRTVLRTVLSNGRSAPPQAEGPSAPPPTEGPSAPLLAKDLSATPPAKAPDNKLKLTVQPAHHGKPFELQLELPYFTLPLRHTHTH